MMQLSRTTAFDFQFCGMPEAVIVGLDDTALSARVSPQAHLPR